MLFNLKTKGKDKLLNYEGAQAYRLSSEWQLYVAVVTSTLNDKFYEDGAMRIEKLRQLITQCNPLFVAQLAIYARREMNLRSIPLVLAVELCKVHRGDSLVSNLVKNIILRADEIGELLAYYQLANEREGVKKLNALSKQIQLGLQDAFNRFDEYQFAKYDGQGMVKLRDALFLTHPKAKDNAQQLLFNKIVNKELSVPYTWEIELSKLGQQSFSSLEDRQQAFCSKWEELIDSKKMGYMALLRNLRNMLQAEVSTPHLMKVCDYLSNADAVRQSKQLPFRFLAAHREISAINSNRGAMVQDALEKAVAISTENIAGFSKETSVLIACDVSGSMQQPISARSRVLNYDIGLMLAMLLKRRCEHSIIGMFGDVWKTIPISTTQVLANVDAFYKREGEVGYATNGHLVIESLIETKQIIEKVIIFTDCQMWTTTKNDMTKAWSDYKKISPKSKLYLFDLVGYGMVPLNIINDDVWLIAGWSDKIFDMMAATDRGSNALDEIKKIQIN
ncbi:MAG: TROVE domain-containing protein [Mangrovibacterium sp.]